MQFNQSNNTYQIYLEKGESVIDELTEFCKKNKILNGIVTGIGAVNETELGAFDLSKKEYLKKKFKDDHELISFSGNIMLLNGEPFIHAHSTIGNYDMEIFGGHVFKMTIAVVGEFIIQEIGNNAKRTVNEQIGLATWDLINE